MELDREKCEDKFPFRTANHDTSDVLERFVRDLNQRPDLNISQKNKEAGDARVCLDLLAKEAGQEKLPVRKDPNDAGSRSHTEPRGETSGQALEDLKVKERLDLDRLDKRIVRERVLFGNDHVRLVSLSKNDFAYRTPSLDGALVGWSKRVLDALTGNTAYQAEIMFDKGPYRDGLVNEWYIGVKAR